MHNSEKTIGLVVCGLFVVALISFSACSGRGGNNPVPTGPTITYKISIVSGNNQTGKVGTQLPASLKVYVTDDSGVRQTSVTVKYSVIEGYGDLSTVSALTDTAGIAESFLTPTDYAGTVKVEAKVRYTDTAVTFTETAID